MKDPHRPWAMWRQIWYGTGFTSFWLSIGLLVYFTNYYEPANCLDGVLNNNEVEVDAGGPCVPIPHSQIIPAQVAWAESFEVTPGRYNAVAYIENRNDIAGTPMLPYTFKLYGDTGQVVGERVGEAVLPPDQVYPVFEAQIVTNERVVRTELELGRPRVWLPAQSNVSDFRTVDVRLEGEDERPRVYATLENQGLQAVQNVEAVTTIFNDLGVPVAASETLVEQFAGRSTSEVIFTWPQPIGKTVRSCSIPTDIILGIDLSGSMNNDNDTPPQPLTDAVVAAGTFVNNLGILDQVGVVTFATDAATAQILNDQHPSVSAIVQSLQIAPVEETGFTNTAAAFTAALAELTSVRHNNKANRAFVILTDGLPTAAGDIDAEDEALTAADRLRQVGVDVYAIGLGQNVDRDFVSALAGTAANAYLAPSRDDLSDIYAQITASLCEVGPTKIEVIAKPPVSFAPVR